MVVVAQQPALLRPKLVTAYRSDLACFIESTFYEIMAASQVRLVERREESLYFSGSSVIDIFPARRKNRYSWPCCWPSGLHQRRDQDQQRRRLFVFVLGFKEKLLFDYFFREPRRKNQPQLKKKERTTPNLAKEWQQFTLDKLHPICLSLSLSTLGTFHFHFLCLFVIIDDILESCCDRPDHQSRCCCCSSCCCKT